MATLAELNVVIGAKIDNFERNMAAAEKGIGRLSGAAQDAGEAMTKYVTLPISLAAGAALKAAGDIQALEKGFAATYKGSLPLQEALANVRELAKLPGLGLKEALQGATNLQAAGLSADLAQRSLAAFGNALATVGRGKADLDGVGLALGQIAAKGKISAEEINQLAERVPQIREAMKAAFGTADTEVLNKLKIDATTFVEGVVAELEKLPKVTGGLNNAFENFGDGVTIALSKVGASLNKTFDIEGKLNRLGDFINGLASSFESLSPAVQKTVFVVAGLAAAAGPVLFVIGSIGAALPALTAGFAALGVTSVAALGPIGIAAAAVAAAGLLVYQNWDRVAPIFDELGQVFSQVVDIFSRFASIVASDFARLGITTADFGGAMKIVGQIITDMLILPFRVLVGGIESAVGAFRVFANFLQGDLQGAADGARQVLDGIKLAFLGITKAVEPQGSGISDYFANLTSQALGVLGGIQKATGELDTFAKTATAVVVRLTAEQQTALANLRKELQLNIAYEKVLGDTYDEVKNRASILEGGVKKLTEAFGLGSPIVAKYLAQLRIAERQLSDAEVKPLDAGAVSVDLPKNNLPATLKPIDDSAYQASQQRILAAQRAFNEEYGANVAMTVAINENIGSIIAEGAANAFNAIGIAIGNVLSGTATLGEGLQQAFRGVLGAMGSFIVDFGKMLIQQATLTLAASQLATNPVTAPLAIGIGLAAIAVGTALSAIASKGPALSKGGGGGAAPRASSSYSAPRTSRAGTQAEKQAPVTNIHEVNILLTARGSDLAGVLQIQADRYGRVTGGR